MVKLSAIWQGLKNIPDPEIPVISIVELGVVRDVKYADNQLQIDITPTYSGCPAMEMMKQEIKKMLIELKIETFKINTVLSPPWTTEWINDAAKQKLKQFGIAPPKKEINCPQCNSDKVEIISEFGSTACKALYKCKDCLEPFDYFKCI